MLSALTPRAPPGLSSVSVATNRCKKSTKMLLLKLMLEEILSIGNAGFDQLHRSSNVVKVGDH